MTPLSMKMTRLETSRANSISWVDDHGQTFFSEVLHDLQHFPNHFRVQGGSWFIKGMASGSMERARAIATRCFGLLKVVRTGSNIEIPYRLFQGFLWQLFCGFTITLEDGCLCNDRIFKTFKFSKRLKLWNTIPNFSR